MNFTQMASNKKKTKKKIANRSNHLPIRMAPISIGMGASIVDMNRALYAYERSSSSEEDDKIHASLVWTSMSNKLKMDGRRAALTESLAGLGRDYPGHPMVDENFELSEPEVDALRSFRNKRPFKISNQEYLEAAQELVNSLSDVHDILPPVILHSGEWEIVRDESGRKISPSHTSFYTPHVIVLSGPKSIITLLHEYTHARGFGETVAVMWSTNAFRIMWPKSFGKLKQSSLIPHTMIRAQNGEGEAPETITFNDAVNIVSRRRDRDIDDEVFEDDKEN